MTRPTRYAVTLPEWGRVVVGPETDIPSVLDAMWAIVKQLRLPVEVIEP